MKEGKATRTIYPDGTVGVYFRMDEADYQKFVEKCDRDGLKIKGISSMHIQFKGRARDGKNYPKRFGSLH